ncbi:MAG: hypothetical protein ACYC1D_12730 [Acidimicrobiales bacterium]
MAAGLAAGVAAADVMAADVMGADVAAADVTGGPGTTVPGVVVGTVAGVGAEVTGGWPPEGLGTATAWGGTAERFTTAALGTGWDLLVSNSMDATEATRMAQPTTPA